MKYIEVYEDLFNYASTHMLAHCISADLEMGAGIAVEFNRRFNTKNKLITAYGKSSVYPNVLVMENVFNLVTKERYWHKPTLSTLESTLITMRDISIQYNIKKIAMPRIGCCRDKLNWADVRELIKKVFNDTNIEILIAIK